VAERLYANGASYQVDQYDAYGYRSERLLDYSDPWGFGAQAGYYTDLETGLLLLTHRFYDPNMGRFLTRDPLGYRGGINLYGYVRNNPVNGSDPSGYYDDDDPDKHPGTGDSNINSESEQTTGSNPENPGSGSGVPRPSDPGLMGGGAPSGGGGGGGGGAITFSGGEPSSPEPTTVYHYSPNDPSNFGGSLAPNNYATNNGDMGGGMARQVLIGGIGPEINYCAEITFVPNSEYQVNYAGEPFPGTYAYSLPNGSPPNSIVNSWPTGR